MIYYGFEIGMDGAHDPCNRGPMRWDLVRDDAMTAAILDQLLHRSHVLSIRGRSYRLQELERMLK